MITKAPKTLRHVRSALYSQPWAIMEKNLEAICEIFEAHLAADKIDISAYQGNGGIDEEWADYDIVNGWAILPIQGPIFPKSNMMTNLSGATSLEEFRTAFRRALSDNAVQGLLLKSDSPGGSVSGLSEMASEIYNSRMDSGKPVKGLAEGMCCSAAYMLLSQCDEVFCTEGSMVGSIGTIMKIDSYDRMQKNEGIDSIVLRSSELKAPGSGPITPRQEDSMRKILNTYFEQFKNAVERGREGAITDINEVATGEVWIGQEAVNMGLCDRLSTLEEIIGK